MSSRSGSLKALPGKKKKTSQGNGKFTKHHSKGGGQNGSTKSKIYRKQYRGQG